MVIFTKRESYEKQIAIYLGNRDYQKAYELSKEFVERFSTEMIAHFLLMKSAFWLKNFDEAIKEGREAFNLSHGEDMLTCAIILSSAYYLNGNQEECYKLLGKMKTEGNPDVEKLMFIYSLAANNEQEAMTHIDKLYKINRRLAEEFIMKFL
ncbi:hypothetical protein J4450_00255 [Candidatus Micrarchaeota archaeon]|nr:hypothetical protein [Candidatus Micrarchaeota archaeon]